MRNKRRQLTIAVLACSAVVGLASRPTLGWEPPIICDGICYDVTWDCLVDEVDFLTVAGYRTGEYYFCPSGEPMVIWIPIISGYDWILFNGPDLGCHGAVFGAFDDSLVGDTIREGPFDLPPISPPAPSLLVSGKRSSGTGGTKLEDRFYVFDDSGQFVTDADPVTKRLRGTLVDDYRGEVHQIHAECGLVRLSDGKAVVPPGAVSVGAEPRYMAEANVYFGLHEDDGGRWWGRAVVDAAFGPDGDVYVAPVVVAPEGQAPYKAGAKLELHPGETPAYTIVQLYDDPDASNPGDTRNLNGLREIEVDRAGNVYIINGNAGTESDTLWVFDTAGTMLKRVELGDEQSTCYIPAPMAMHVSPGGPYVYLASTVNDSQATSSLLYAIAKADLLESPGDPTAQTVSITGMGHIMGITEDPRSGTIWVIGFTNDELSGWPDPADPPFYHPYLAEVPLGATSATAVCIENGNDLALPMSILWTGECFPSDNPAYDDWAAMEKPECWCAPLWGSGYQCDGDAAGDTENPIIKWRVSASDLSIVTMNWKKTIVDPTLDPCADIDHQWENPIIHWRVSASDLSMLISHWKWTDAQLPGNCPRSE